eukprot:TRINITY_DN3465_c0_g6_i1.p1 TRINITY_DN3465_c0_g6~~TRINITY_DN3465_c0_g6_i1.p1  ORF type:complete len:432 (-),score=60.97 TRINITY_DN3465_c0_g6_i1:285-1580(-)
MAPRLVAMDGPRYMASLMIVLGHYYFEHNPMEHVVVSIRGCYWTQFFFILSGFVLAYQEMVRPAHVADRLSLLGYLKRRLVPIYPAYLLATLIVCAFKNVRTCEWKFFSVSALLMQAWLPIWFTNDGEIFPAEPPYTFMAMNWNSKTWFVSVLVFYWMLLRPLAAMAKKLSLRSAVVTTVLLWLFSLVPGMAWESLPEDALLRDVVFKALHYGPAGYLHVFASGVVGARIFVLTALSEDRQSLRVENPPFYASYGAVLGYLIYFICVPSMKIPQCPSGRFLLLHNGGFVPIHLLIIMACAVGVDPLAKYVFCSRIFNFLGRISYSQYLLQGPLWLAVTNRVHDPYTARKVFPVVLLLSAYLTEAFVVSPCTALIRRLEAFSIAYGETATLKATVKLNGAAAGALPSMDYAAIQADGQKPRQSHVDKVAAVA